MAEIFQHQKPNERIVSWATRRREEIRKQLAALGTEDVMLSDILARVKPLVCHVCDGEGYVMRPIPGCECDGPRMTKCTTCKGTGNPTTADGDVKE